MSADTFVDTHILIYAHDLDAGDRQGRGAALLQGLWGERRGILTTQMLQEFYVNVTVKMPTPISLSAARGLLSTYAAWQVEADGVETVLLATEIQEKPDVILGRHDRRRGPPRWRGDPAQRRPESRPGHRRRPRAKPVSLAVDPVPPGQRQVTA